MHIFAHVLSRIEASLFSAVPEIQSGSNNAPLDSPVSLTNAAQSALSSLWICPQHLFTKLSGANQLARTGVRAAL